MKILYFNNPTVEYLSCLVYHGLISLGHDVYELYEMPYMYKCKESIIDRNTLYGKGFSYAFKLENEYNYINILNELEDKINEHFFDIIIFCDYTNVHNNYKEKLNKYFPLILDKYNFGEIFIIDGRDESSLCEIAYWKNINKVIYFKRELVCGNYPAEINYRVFPISYAIPKNNFRPINENKNQLCIGTTRYFDQIWKFLQPIHNNNSEDEYYDKYNNAYFVMTGRKGGYDCMRHYEIIAAGSLPVFIDYLHVPQGCMITWPSSLQLAANSLYIDYMAPIKHNEYDKLHKYYHKLLRDFYDYAYHNLTTENLAEYILNFV